MAWVLTNQVERTLAEWMTMNSYQRMSVLKRNLWESEKASKQGRIWWFKLKNELHFIRPRTAEKSFWERTAWTKERQRGQRCLTTGGEWGREAGAEWGQLEINWERRAEPHSEGPWPREWIIQPSFILLAICSLRGVFWAGEWYINMN